ncbi:MAG: hypothetical protein ACSHXZ_14865 [Gammaproteobacteria bacterium]
MNGGTSTSYLMRSFTDGRRFRVLAVVDDLSSECLALVTDTSLSGLRNTRELDDIIKRRGRPHSSLDNITSGEFATKMLLQREAG